MDSYFISALVSRQPLSIENNYLANNLDCKKDYHESESSVCWCEMNPTRSTCWRWSRSSKVKMLRGDNMNANFEWGVLIRSVQLRSYRGIQENGSFFISFYSQQIFTKFSSPTNQFCLYGDNKNIVVDDSLGDGEHDSIMVLSRPKLMGHMFHVLEQMLHSKVPRNFFSRKEI